MSAITRPFCNAIAIVKPYLGEDLESGGTLYGDTFEMKCTWAAESTQMRDATGAEFVSKYIIWSEDPRPKYRDMILLSTLAPTDWQEIRSHMEWDMLCLGDPAPDYRTVT